MGATCKAQTTGSTNPEIVTDSQQAQQTRKPEDMNNPLPPRLEEMEVQLEQSAQIVFTLKDKVDELQDQVQQLQQLLDQKARNTNMNELTAPQSNPSNAVSQPQFFTFHDKEQIIQEQESNDVLRKISIQEQLHP